MLLLISRPPPDEIRKRERDRKREREDKVMVERSPRIVLKLAYQLEPDTSKGNDRYFR